MDTLIGIVVLGAFMAGFAQGLSGFAFGLVSMSVWAWFLEPQIAAPLSVSGAFLGQSLGLFTVKRSFNPKVLLPFLLGGVAGIPLGLWLIPHINADVFKLMLGTLLVLFCPVMLFSSRLSHFRYANPWADGAFGIVGGVLSGIGGFAGAVPSLWCTVCGMDKVTQRGVIQNFSLGILGITFFGHVWGGHITSEVLSLLVWVIPAVIIAVVLGSRIYIGISEAAFKKVILTLLTFSGITMLISALSALM